MKRTLTLLSAFALAISMFVVPAAAAPGGGGQPVDQHCAGHQTEVKVEVPQGWDFDVDGPYSETVTVEDLRTGEDIDVLVTIDGGNVTFELVDSDLELDFATYCIKGGTNQTGQQTGTSGDTDGIPNRGGQAPDVSYVVLYSVTTVEPDPDDPDEVAGEWCSPGFWKQEHHFQYWPAGISPQDEWMDTGLTLLAVLEGAIHPPGHNANLVADYLSAAAGLEWDPDSNSDNRECTLKD